uniref:Uncharacterized protein n=1 Tax=Salix viminalis TaxID=40686 RepID=A0A6N2KIJ3_SALVM
MLLKKDFFFFFFSFMILFLALSFVPCSSCIF